MSKFTESSTVQYARQRLSEQAKIAAPPREIDAMKTYYHGTSSGAAAEAIKTEGIKPPSITTNGKMAPVRGKVYITPHIQYAMIYGLGANVFGSNSTWQWPEAEGPYGYVFEIAGKDLVDIQPDEDSVGELLMFALRGRDYSSSGKENAILQPEYAGTAASLVSLAETHLTDRQLRRVKEGEVAEWAHCGKKLVKLMSDSLKLSLIDCGAHIAHAGVIYPTKLWRFNKADAGVIKRDGSNFFEHAEEIPLRRPVTAKAAPTLQRHVQEFMKVLDASGVMTIPTIDVVSKSGVDWAGLCSASFKKDNKVVTSVESRIRIQQAIAVEEENARRVIAHECCHHSCWWKHLVNVDPKTALTWFESYQEDEHGKDWKAEAAKLNAIYGANFVAENSDMLVDPTEEPEKIRVFYVVMQRHGRTGELMGWALRPMTPAAKKSIVRRAMYNDVRILKSNDVVLFHSLEPYNESTAIDGTSAKEVSALEKLWEQGEAVTAFNKSAASFGPEDIPPYFYLVFDPEIGRPAFDRVYTTLQSGVMPGVVGISADKAIISQFGYRGGILKMPGVETVEANRLSRVMYENHEYLLSKGMSALYRIWDKNPQTLGGRWGMMQNLVDDINKRMPPRAYKDLNYFGIASVVGHAYGKKPVTINNTHELRDYLFEEFVKAWTEQYGKGQCPFTSQDVERAISEGLDAIARTYNDEAEWLLKDKTLHIPANSSLIVNVDPGYVENLKRWQQYKETTDEKELAWDIEHKMPMALEGVRAEKMFADIEKLRNLFDVTLTHGYEEAAKVAVAVRNHKFGCVMLLPEGEISETVLELSRKLVHDDEVYKDPEDDSFGRVEIPHTTALWGIKQERVGDRIRKVIAKVSPREFRLMNVTFFDDNEDYDVVKFDLAGEDLFAFHDALVEEFPDHEETFDFHPHMTISYVKKGLGKKIAERASKWEGLTVPVRAVDYSRQDGVHEYYTLEGEKTKIAKFKNQYSMICAKCHGMLKPTLVRENPRHHFNPGIEYSCNCGAAKIWGNSIRNEDAFKKHLEEGTVNEYYQGFCNDIYCGFCNGWVSPVRNGWRPYVDLLGCSRPECPSHAVRPQGVVDELNGLDYEGDKYTNFVEGSRNDKEDSTPPRLLEFYANYYSTNKVAAEPTKKMRGSIYYHGTKEAGAKQILRDGFIKPWDLVGKSNYSGDLTPIENRAYLTTDIDVAIRYAAPPIKDYTEGARGYIFEINGAALADVIPDEDAVFEILQDLSDDSNHSGIKSRPKLKKALIEFLEARDGKFTHSQEDAKAIAKELPVDIALSILRMPGVGIAHEGHIPFQDCYSFDQMELIKYDNAVAAGKKPKLSEWARHETSSEKAASKTNYEQGGHYVEST
jgi:hypothetical protein